MVANLVVVSGNARTAQVVRRSQWRHAWLALALAVACRSVTKEEKYAQADNATDLSALVVKDLQDGNARESYEALRAFTVANIGADRATYANSVFTEARPLLTFQRYGGHPYLGAVSELGHVLHSASERELERMYAAFAVGDVATIRRSLEGERTSLSAGNVAMDPELLPHRQFFEGVVALEDFRTNPQRQPSDSWHVVDLMDRAGWTFSRKAMEEKYFFSLVVSAQALDAAGLPDRAMEKWALASQSSYWPRANADFKDLVLTRIESSRDRARRESESELKKNVEPASPNAEPANPNAGPPSPGVGPPSPSRDPEVDPHAPGAAEQVNAESGAHGLACVRTLGHAP